MNNSWVLLLLVSYCNAQWHPGDVMTTTDPAEINRGQDDMLEMELQNVQVALGLANVRPGGYKLTNPRWYLHQGLIHAAAPFEIDWGQTGLLLFTKLPASFSGTQGVIVYDIDELQDYILAVMWYAPDQDNSNRWNVRLFPKTMTPDRTMFEQMLVRSAAFDTSGYKTRSEFGVESQGIMLNANRAKLTIWIDWTNFNETAGPSLNIICRGRGIIPSPYCEEECYPIGACWTQTRCPNGISDCAGDLQCDESCRANRALGNTFQDVHLMRQEHNPE